MAQGHLGHPATESGWQMATRGSQAEQESLSLLHREVQAVRYSSDSIDYHGSWIPHPP
jgi:hypothetical protein